MKLLLIVFMIFFAVIHASHGQMHDHDSLVDNQDLHFHYPALIIPAVTIGYGFVGLHSSSIQHWNRQLNEKLQTPPHKDLPIDDYTMYIPTVGVYLLDAIGVRGRYAVKDQTIVLVTAFALMAPTVYGLKRITKVTRPDGSANNSFPSGHTATAFMGAEFIYQEYRDRSIWYGIVGYTLAAGTGFLRMYNNRHWFTDVLTGAGIGILSTKIAYWIHPWMMNHIFHNRNISTSYISPFYDGNHYGISMTLGL